MPFRTQAKNAAFLVILWCAFGYSVLSLQSKEVGARQLHHSVVGGIGRKIMVWQLSDYTLNVRPVQGEQSQLVAELYL